MKSKLANIKLIASLMASFLLIGLLYVFLSIPVYNTKGALLLNKKWLAISYV